MDFGEHSRRDEGPVNSAALLDGLLRVSQIVRLRLNDWLGHFELNDGRHSVLAVLASAAQEGCSQAELAERLGQSESNISTLIERMQRDGLVNRLRSNADRRKRVLLITPEGRSALESVDSSRSAWAGRLLHGISADDRPRLYSLLQQLGSSLELSTTTPSVSRSGRTAPEMTALAAMSDRPDPTDDPQSPQFALRKMLQALSSSMGDEPGEKDVA
jgi:MarR family transcriptional regulator, negative regulator of the multidrug operon emrRAB